MTTIGNDNDNNCKVEAKFHAVSELMAKKRKLYLYKQVKSIDDNNTSINNINSNSNASCKTSNSIKTFSTTATREDILLTSQSLTSSLTSTTSTVTTGTTTTTRYTKLESKCFLQNSCFTSDGPSPSKCQLHYDYNNPELRICKENEKRQEQPDIYNNNCSCRDNCHSSCRQPSKRHQHQYHYRPQHQHQHQHPDHQHHNVLSNNVAQESSESPQTNICNISNSNQEIHMQNSYYLLRNQKKQNRMSPITSTHYRVSTTATATATNAATMPELDPKLVTSTTHRTCLPVSKDTKTETIFPYPRWRRRSLLSFYYNIIMILKTLLNILLSSSPSPAARRHQQHQQLKQHRYHCAREKLDKKRQHQHQQVYVNVTVNANDSDSDNDNDNDNYYDPQYYCHQNSLLRLEQRLTHSNDQQQQQQQQQQQESQKHCHYNAKKQKTYSSPLRLPNLSIAKMIITVLSLLSLSVPLTQALTSDFETTLQSTLATLERSAREVPPTTELEIAGTTSKDHVRLARPEHVCKSLDIRNSASEFHQLENCTVIEGFLLITLLSGNSLEDYNETFPLLTEVTEYIVVYQVHYLRSIGRIFPNLSVIRGRNLFEGYALIVYSNSHLEELGLTKLTTISRGGVRIEKNVMLCFVDSIKWDEIVSNNTDTAIKDNRDNIECPACPGDQWNTGETNEISCKQHQGHRYCWNSKSCQKFCPPRCRNNCIDEYTCCNEACLGGCSPDNVNECISCRNFSIYNTTCTDKCPENYYTFLDRRCLTAEACGIIGTKFENNRQEVLVAYEGSCSTVCPEGYIKVNMTCVQCNDNCIKKCQGGLIDSVARAKELHGCTHIVYSPLVINIKRGGRHLMDGLAYGLSSIVSIETALKVHGTYGLFDLKFFKNLQKIEGKILIENEYAFYVLENADMETIWNPNQTVQILKGTVYFHFNPKLCIKEINTLLPMLNKEEFDQKEVSDSNGSRGSCNTTLLNVTLTRTVSLVAIVRIENPITYEDQRTFIGYQFLHIEDPFGNATEHAFRPCEDGWEVSEPTKATIYIFQNLKPYTRYAYYVKTLTLSSERRNGQSRIQHFRTKSDQPKNVNKLQAYANSSHQIIMNWLPPTTANGKLIKYKIRAVYDKHIQRIESRNYCKDPLKEVGKPDIPLPTITEKPTIPKNCNCKKSNNQMYDDDEIDASIHASIELENALQNFVYVKKENKTRIISANKMLDFNSSRNRRAAEGDSFDSFLLRHIRDSPSEAYIHDDTTTPSTTTTSTATSTSGGSFTTTVDPRNDATLSFNETRWNSDDEFYEVVVDSVNASRTDYIFSNLKHFSWYLLGVEACREKDSPNDTLPDCSIEVKTYVRTLRLENVDKIEEEHFRAEIETTNSSRSNIRVFWKRPPHPNGAVVSYTILYMLQAPDSVEDKKCITEVDYVELGYQTNGYVITGLSTGNYSIRIRTNTLAGEGELSNTIYKYIEPVTMATSVIVGITVGTLSVLILIGILIYCLYRRRILTPPSDLKIFPSVNPHYISLQYIPDEWEVSRDQVIQLNPLGQGSFGMVYEGILKSYKDDSVDIPCAIKTVNENATDRERMNFLNEACVMKQFDTYHVVRLLGVCSRGQPALVVMELMKNGDLKSYLRAHRPDERDDMGMPMSSRTGAVQPPPISRIYQMAIEIADGMAYLAAKKFVHRDLAARNCMVAADLTVKIGDFGMTRDIYENDYYRKGTKGLLPVRWMPPESLRDGVYSTASDVFSYGVVLWEMATLASQPYQGLSNDQVLRYVIDGGVMERPENCPDKLYSLMQKCWHHRPSARPTFMEIIRYLLDLADPHFSEVSYYHSEDGQKVMKQELAERNQSSGDVFDDHENDMEDVTTPLRLEEYSDYKVNMDINSSVEHRGDSSMVMDDDAPHSPYSLTGSPMVISSTPDEQLRNSYNMPRIMNSHNPMLNSAPSTSAELRKMGPSTSYYTHPHTHPHHRNLYQPTRYAQQQQQHQGRLQRSDDADAYVLPDLELKDLMEMKRNSDERGYEMYDPSPNYCEKAPSNIHDDDEDDMGVQSTAVQNLLTRSKPHPKQPTIMPLSSSMPDEVIGQPASSSLHPSTASAASSNTSSKTGTGKYPSLRAVADSLGNNVTAKFRSILFNTHKRSGSNASYKSTSSNPNSAGVGAGASGSSNNLTRGGRGKSMSGQNLGTIESGGSGSAGSYCGNPKFFAPNNTGGTTSENPNYKRLDDDSGDIITNRPKMSSTSAFSMSSNPNYQVLDESLNTTGASTSTNNPNSDLLFHTSDNPNYQLMQAPAKTQKQDNSLSYVMMNEPIKALEPSAISISDNPNYQMMEPPPPSSLRTIPSSSSSVLPQKEQQTQIQSQPQSQVAISRIGGKDRFTKYSSSSSAMSTSSSHETDEDDDDIPTTTTKGMKSDRIPLSRRSSNDRSQKKKHINNRSRSQSSSSSSRSSNTATTTSQHQSTSRPPIGLIASSTLLTKENWLKQPPAPSQQHQQQPPPPPPNGFVGRETS